MPLSHPLSSKTPPFCDCVCNSKQDVGLLEKVIPLAMRATCSKFESSFWRLAKAAKLRKTQADTFCSDPRLPKEISPQALSYHVSRISPWVTPTTKQILHDIARVWFSDLFAPCSQRPLKDL